MSTYPFKLTDEEESLLQENYPTELERILARTALEEMNKLFDRGTYLREEQIRISKASNDYLLFLKETTGAETFSELHVGQLLKLQILNDAISRLEDEVEEIDKIIEAKYGSFLQEMP